MATLDTLQFTASRDATLPDDAIRFYHDNGYLVLKDALTADEVQELRDDAVRIVRREYAEFPGAEPPAPGETDDDLMARHLCIHFPHKISPVMRRYLSHPAIVHALTGVIGPNVKCMQSMLFIKSAGMPGQAWHQDEDYIPTRDRSLCGAWIAMDDANTDNGCLWVIPGSHRPGILWPQEAHGDARFDCTWESREFPYTEADEVPVVVEAGSIVFFNGYLLHRSLPNTRATGYRRALVNHYMSAESLLPWFPKKATPPATTDCRDIVMVAGEDPYAYKGIEEINKPMVRPSGKGGCVDGSEDINKRHMK